MMMMMIMVVVMMMMMIRKFEGDCVSTLNVNDNDNYDGVGDDGDDGDDGDHNALSLMMMMVVVMTMMMIRKCEGGRVPTPARFLLIAPSFWNPLWGSHYREATLWLYL